MNWWSCVNCSSPVFLKHTVYIHTCCWCITVAQNAESLVCTHTGLCSAGKSHNKLAISSPVGVVLNFRCIVSQRGWPSGVCAPSVHVVDRVVFVHCQSTWLNKWCLCTVSPCGWPDAFHSLCVLCQLLAGWSSRMAWHTTSAENSSRSRIMIVAMSKVCLKVNGLNSGWVVNVCKENVY